MDDRVFEYIINVYKKLGNDEELIEIMIYFDILRLVACGLSNKTIARRAELDEKIIAKLIKKYYNFDGFTIDTDVDIYTIYKRCEGNIDKFSFEIIICSAYIQPDDIITYYRVCSKFEEIERRLEKEWQ